MVPDTISELFQQRSIDYIDIHDYIDINDFVTEDRRTLLAYSCLRGMSITSLREWIATIPTLLVHILFAEDVANAKEGSC